MRRTKRVGLTSAAAATAMLSLGAVAWACTIQPTISVTPGAVSSAREAGVVRVYGSGFKPSPVEIRWNDDFGLVVGTAKGPEFSASITIPESTPAGLYYLIAIQKDPGASPDGVHSVAKAAQVFEVVTSPGSKVSSSVNTVSKDLWSGFTPATEGQAGSASAELPEKLRPSASRSLLGLAGGVLLAVGALACCFILVAHARRRRLS